MWSILVCFESIFVRVALVQSEFATSSAPTTATKTIIHEDYRFRGVGYRVYGSGCGV